ncbi:colanic acid biosynthesis acetyltransferase WcaF [Polaribacter vadi]|uniref:Colanic acid biosynthesis acetyltransferase WcaF n=1 Tax=Polaribacter vadi TaxID=1774273 RepID=A0A1B8U2X8_9FLAO|nr:putative colanic acid biosynthesis acetyltransferase [Polaribacter vadi]AOW17490.1 colanic acid biosynthesis acetyltransferase WcaF [Polaribacter vadi]OBY66181.1 colanic acid biosynthesis acetyltransferase WcaF [Polaribacter vadi]|tara:strand:- start:831 stop:1379 length:549 start_codon:yes stop_codon:yes gene_type:complete
MQELSIFKLPRNFRGRNAFVVQLWWIVQSIFFKNSPQFLYGFRRFLLRLFGAKIGKKVIIRPSVKITYPWKVSIGDYSWIGDDVVLYSLGEIEIGKNVVISQKCYICTGSHDYLQSDFPIFAKKNIIKDECWLATDVFVAPGVIIGKGSVIGSRSSVYKDIAPNKVCVGNPAKIIRERKIDK